MIKSFAHKGLEHFFYRGIKKGIQPTHSARLRLQLELLNRSRKPQDMNLPNWHLHSLKGELAGYWSVRVNGNWRLIFKFEGEDVILVNYLDYH